MQTHMLTPLPLCTQTLAPSFIIDDNDTHGGHSRDLHNHIDVLMHLTSMTVAPALLSKAKSSTQTPLVALVLVNELLIMLYDFVHLLHLSLKLLHRF